ncbi:hypothetical protein ACFU6I_06845 [Streptomyces sp. NPDC057486]|uniref:hypothetical protein n=1 Tax=Streptomyces sp. NPDC057486 TaxID=3346145 RepID=UPI00369D2F5A
MVIRDGCWGAAASAAAWSRRAGAVWRRLITAWLARLGFPLLALGMAVFTARRQAPADP